jgi:hypothetical protein
MPAGVTPGPRGGTVSRRVEQRDWSARLVVRELGRLVYLKGWSDDAAATVTSDNGHSQTLSDINGVASGAAEPHRGADAAPVVLRQAGAPADVGRDGVVQHAPLRAAEHVPGRVELRAHVRREADRHARIVAQFFAGAHARRRMAAGATGGGRAGHATRRVARNQTPTTHQNT